MPALPEDSAPTLLGALREVLVQAAEPIRVLRSILEQAVAQTGADRGVFVEITGSGELAYRVLHRFQREDFVGEAGRFSRSVFAEVIRRGEGILLRDAMREPQFLESRSVQTMRIVSILCMPVPVSGRIAALVHLQHRNPGHFNEEHRRLLNGLLQVAGPVLEALQAGDVMIRERDEARSDLSREWSFARFVGRSSVVRELGAEIQKAAGSDAPVLLTGETGTGKGILARVLHHAGPRSRRAFVTVFCPSLERGMVESELFGARKGAFTGALTDRNGKLQTAERGTFFLDEIGDLPLEIQPKLLRLLQERTFERVGDPAECRADVRIIAATNRDLEVEIRAGRFRRDLFERLNYLPVRIPPLRERREDIPALLAHFLAHHDSGRWIEISSDGMQYLMDLDFSWPGNVRHLEQLAARLAADGPRRPVQRGDIARLLQADLSHRSETVEPARSAAEGGLEAGLPTLLAQAEKSWLEEALHRYPGITRAQLSEKLKISESALYKKLRIYGLGG